MDLGKNVEVTKYYTFNETGNIMLATTVGASADVQDSVRRVFAEVSVFFAAMTKALTRTTNPVTKEPYSIYNYDALAKIIAGSGCFIRVTESDISHTTSSFGATFSKELLEGLLGLATGVGALGFATGMIAAIGKEGAKLAGKTDDDQSRVGNIVFVCEYLLGMPCISAIVVNVVANKHAHELTIGPCLSTKSQEVTFKMHKDTYMFVTPAFIREFAGDLNSINTQAAYGQLVSSMEAQLKGEAAVQIAPAGQTQGGGPAATPAPPQPAVKKTN